MVQYHIINDKVMPSKKTKEQFFKKLGIRNSKFPTVFPVDSNFIYERALQKIDWKCENNHIFTAIIKNVLNKGSGCRKCSQANNIPVETFLKRVEERNIKFPTKVVKIKDISEYGGMTKKITWSCMKGHEWTALPKTVVKGTYCTICANTTNGINQTYTLDKIQEKLNKYNKTCLPNWEEDYDNTIIYKKQLIQMINFFKELECNVDTTSDFDILIKDYNLAINLRGLKIYTHDKIKVIDYNKKDYELAERQGLRLITIFSDEWKSNKTKVKDSLRYFVKKAQKGTAGRKCIIKEIPWKTAKMFLDKYHLLDSGAATKIKLGAFDNNKLVAVMTFGRPANEQGEVDYYEMTRFVTDKKTHPGLGSKMFKHAVKQYSLTKVIAFVDKRWFTGRFKSISGFNIINKTKPTKWYTDGKKRYHRRFITKEQLISKHGFSPDISKNVAMFSLGYKTIYDCGKLKLEWNSE